MWESHETYINAMNKLQFSDESKARMTENLLNTPHTTIKRHKRLPLRTALTAAAVCAALAATAWAAAPGVLEALRAKQGVFAPYSQPIEGAVCADQGIEIQVISALSDDVRGWVYYTVRDTEADRLDSQLTLDGSMTVSTTEPRDKSIWASSPAELEYDQLVSYDPDTKTALFAKQYWFGDDFEPVQNGHFSAVGITTQRGRLGQRQDSTADCSSVTGEILESLPATAADEVIFSPGDVEGAPYGDEVLPLEQFVLAPGQNRVPIAGNEDIWVSSMGIAADGCFHVRLEAAEGVQMGEQMLALVYPRNDAEYTEAHFTIQIRKVENGIDILFPMLHAGEVEDLDYAWFSGSYTRPGAEITGDWSMDFPFVYHASKVLDWTGEIHDYQVTRATISPLSITMSICGESDIGRWEDASAQLLDGTVIGTRPSTGLHANKGELEQTGTDYWEIYATWEFTEPVDVEDVAFLNVMGQTIPVNAAD